MLVRLQFLVSNHHHCKSFQTLFKVIIKKGTDNICRNNGSCYTNSGKVLCLCPPGWTGMLCEILIDTCDSSPCKNGGNCSSTVNNYTCICDGIYFKGYDCDEGNLLYWY